MCTLMAMFALLFLPAFTEGQAKTVSLNKSVSSGKSTKIDVYQGWNKDCSFLTIDIYILRKPTSGSARAKVVNSKITRAEVGRVGSCTGKPTKGLAIYYKSKPGYHGVDNLTVKMKARGYPSVTFKYRIRVR